MTDRTLDTLVQRLDRLERVNWRWKMIGGNAALAMGILFFLGAGGSPPNPIVEEVRAKRFVLIDVDGKERARLHTFNVRIPTGLSGVKAGSVRTAELTFYDHQGKPLAALGEAELVLLDPTGLRPEYSPYLALSDPDGPRALMGSQVFVTSTGTAVRPPISSLILLDRNAKTIWKAP